MPPRPSPPSTTIVFSEAEFDLAVAMMQAQGIGTLTGLIHVALWNMAQRLDFDPPINVFAATTHTRTTKRKK